MSHRKIIILEPNVKSETLESLYISKRNGLAIGILPRVSEISIKDPVQFIPKPIVIEDILGRKQKINDPKFWEY